jgi:proline racemase
MRLASMISAVNAHACGEPGRVIVGGVLDVPPLSRPEATARNVGIVSSGRLDWERPATWTGAIDRSPCGTGTCARLAVLHAKGRPGIGEDFAHEGILGTVSTGRLVEETRVGDIPAVVPTLAGSAWITGFASYVVDPDDPFRDGFTVGDIWGAAVG